MASGGAQAEVERRLRDIGARLGSLPGSNKELLSLVEEAEIWLARVDQSPPKSMHDALKPTMDALVNKDLLNHPSQGIKVAVACCLTEVTRITAPEPPYGDDVMRDVFTVVVQSFAKLDDTESALFAKRVSMLETVAKVRSCVLMLDLECDDLILNTFDHFFSTISSTHQENVITSMETIMMFVIQESEPVHSDLASCLLRYLKKEKKDSLPASFMLAERIVGLCPEKLKPAFIELLQGTPLNDYSEAVALLVEGSSDAGRDDEVDAVGEDTVGEDTVNDKNLSQMAVSDESPQDSSRSEKGVNSPGQDGSPPYSTPAASLSNGGVSVDNAKPPNGPASKQKPSDVKRTKVSDEVTSDDKEAPEPVTEEPEKPSGARSKKNRKLDTSNKSKVTERSKVDSDNEGLVACGELSPETEVGNNKLTLETCNRAADDTSKPVDSTPAVNKPRRGRPPAVKSQEKKPVGMSEGSGLESKELRSGSTSGGRARRLAKDIKLSPRKTGEEESSKKQPKGSSNPRKEDTPSDEDTDEDLSLKEMASPKSLTKSGKTKGQPGDSGVSKRKRGQEVEEVPESKNIVLDKSLVGSRVKVWWPDDKKFYTGVVKSFETSSKKHKVVYDDGDIEQLQLKTEKWEFVDEDEDMNPNATSDTPRGGRGKGNRGQQTKEGKTETPKSSKQDSIEDSDPPKKRGRPKGVRSSMPNDDSPVTSARSKVKSEEKDAEETPKAGSNLKKGGGRWPRSSGKASDKDEAKSSGGSKTNGLSAKRKPKEKEVESSEEEDPEEPEPESAKASTGKKRRRKFA